MQCDRLIPQCTQCEKHNINCEPRNFRHWKAPTGNRTGKSNNNNNNSNSTPLIPTIRHSSDSAQPVVQSVPANLAQQEPIRVSPGQVAEASILSPEQLDTGVGQPTAGLCCTTPSSTDRPAQLVKDLTAGQSMSLNSCTQESLSCTGQHVQLENAPVDGDAQNACVDDNTLDFAHLVMQMMQNGNASSASVAGGAADIMLDAGIINDDFYTFWPAEKHPAQSINGRFGMPDVADLSASQLLFDASSLSRNDASQGEWQTTQESRRIPQIRFIESPRGAPDSGIPGRVPAMPPELLSSVEKGFLWHHFVHRTAPELNCYDYDTPNTPRLEDSPICSLVPILAFEHGMVLAACLALSAVHYIKLEDNRSFGAMIPRLMKEAESGLRTVVHAGASNSTSKLVAAIYTALLLGVCDARKGSQGHWGILLDYIHKLLLPLISRSTGSSTDRSENQSGTTTLGSLVIAVKYMEVIFAVSFRSPRSHGGLSTTQTLEQYRTLEMEFDIPDIVTKAQDPTLVVDPLLAFSPRLVQPLKQLGFLIDATAQLVISGVSEGTGEFQSLVDSLEEALLEAYDLDVERTKNDARDAKELLICNVCFHTAAHLLFYTRLRNMSSTATIVRRKVRDIINATRRIPASCRTSAALAFPLFTAGCEAVGLQDRDIILNRLESIKGMCFSDIERMCAILNKVWEIRDSDPGLSWTSWTAEGLWPCTYTPCNKYELTIHSPSEIRRVYIVLIDLLVRLVPYLT